MQCILSTSYCKVHFLFIVFIEENLKDMTIFEGDSATLCCVTSDSCTPVTWKRNNVTLLPGEKYEPLKHGKRNILLIHKVRKEDAGIYMCDTGDMQSSATLTVKGRNCLKHICSNYKD